MNTVPCEVGQDIDFSSSQEECKRFYEKLKQTISQEDISVTLERQDEWLKSSIKDADSLIRDIKQLALRVASEEEYNWIREVAYDWDDVWKFFEIASLKDESNKPRKVRREILDSLSPKLLSSSSKREISKEYLLRDAYYLGEARKERLILENRRRIHQLIPSNPEEVNADWYKACTYFCSKVLEGKIVFSSEVTSELYPCLEGVWLEDLKQLKAYDVWQENGDGWNSDESLMKSYYFKACKQLADSLSASYIRAPLCWFGDLEGYLKKNYLTDEKKLYDLTKRKFDRLGEKTGRSDSQGNWLSAERYVKDFYENIIPAVKINDSASISKVKKVLADPDHYYMMNCFEAAIVIYFLKPEILQDIKEI